MGAPHLAGFVVGGGRGRRLGLIGRSGEAVRMQLARSFQVRRLQSFAVDIESPLQPQQFKWVLIHRHG